MSSCTTAELRERLGEVLGRAAYGKEIIRVTRHGKPYAAIVSKSDADLLRAFKSLTSDQRRALLARRPGMEG